MKKIPPPSLPHEILPPNTAYIYFENWRSVSFQEQAHGFSLVNAWWLADTSLLVYADQPFILQALQTAGLTSSGFEVRFFEQQNTQCLVIHNPAMILLAFRGTEVNNFWGAVMDWATDLKFLPVPDGAGGLVHQGFYDALEAVWTEVQAYITPLMHQGSTTRTLWITGHSLGAALATLAADRAQRAGLTVQGLYTFGSPRVGDRGFKAHFAAQGVGERTYRIVNNSDIVTRVPPPGLYTHVGILKYIDNAGHLHAVNDEADIAGSVEGLLPLQALLQRFHFLGHEQSLVPFIVPGFLADHAPIYYAIYLWNNVP